jgi:hypothetical protein
MNHFPQAFEIIIRIISNVYKNSEDIRMSRFTNCINDTGGIAVVVVIGGKFLEVSHREISPAV